MDLQPYLPVILFILVGVAVGVAPQLIGYAARPATGPTQPRTPPTNAASRPSRTRA